MIEGAIFDLDGTLFDSMMAWDNLAENYLASLGITAEEGLSQRLKTIGISEGSHILKQEYDLSLSPEEIEKDINQFVERYYREIVLPKDGVREFLSLLAKKNVRMCIATATNRPLVEMALKRCGMEQYFSRILTCGEVGYNKNTPHIFRTALDVLQTPKEKTVVFEDAFLAIQTAKTDGFFTAAVQDVYEPRQEEIINLSNFYITDFNQLSDFWKAVEDI